MTETELYKRCDAALKPLLESKGFRRERAANYVRQIHSGEERIMVSKGPPSKAGAHFSVWLTFHPEYMRPIEELFEIPSAEVGALTPPYLTPVGANSRPKYWSCANSDSLQKSLPHVMECLENAGFKWLESLHDPKVYAANADPVAALPYGLANEVAGNFDRARAGYHEALERLRKIIALFEKGKAPESEILKKDAKPFIFVAAKLNVERERAEYFRKRLNYHPQITPLPPST